MFFIIIYLIKQQLQIYDPCILEFWLKHLISHVIMSNKPLKEQELADNV